VKKIILLTFLVGIFGLNSCTVSENQTGISELEINEGFINLLNKDSLSGWKVHEGPDWKEENGVLIGPAKSSGWIATEEEYDDFVLRLEYWIDPGKSERANSGILIRAGISNINTWTDGSSPRVDGYEIQIDQGDEKNPTGSIYNQVPTSLKQVQQIAPEKTWNKLEIKALGSRIQVWINGKQLQDANLSERFNGFVGLQQHHSGSIVKFRNIRIKHLTPDDEEKGWISMFNGENFDGWTIRGKARWWVNDGVMTGIGGLGHIYADPIQTDCEVRGMFKTSTHRNSGLYFRCNPPADNLDSYPNGYEAQIHNHGDDDGTGYLWKPGSHIGKAEKLITRDNQWFSLRLKAVGTHLQIWINGQLMSENYDDEYKKGYFAIQAHNPGKIIEAKELYYRDLTQ
jgi:hypothetical protein